MVRPGPGPTSVSPSVSTIETSMPSMDVPLITPMALTGERSGIDSSGSWTAFRDHSTGSQVVQSGMRLDYDRLQELLYKFLAASKGGQDVCSGQHCAAWRARVSWWRRWPRPRL